MRKIIIYLMMSMILIGAALAIGVAPVKTIVDFESGAQEEITVRIINSEHKDFKAVIYAEGSLAEYIELTSTLIAVRADEDSKSLSFNINMPDSFSKPGTHEAKITVLEFPKEFATEDANTMITAVSSVVTKVIVRVPYPGLYAEANVIVTQAEVDKPITFTIPISNFGIQDIQKAKATIIICECVHKRKWRVSCCE